MNRRRKSPGPLQVVLLVLAAVAALLVLVGVGAAMWASSYLRSEEFRALLSEHCGRAFGGAAEIRPLTWQGAGVYSAGARVGNGTTTVLQELDAKDLRARLDWRAILGGTWKVEAVDVFDVNLRLGAPAVPASTASDTANMPLPTVGRIEIGTLRAAKLGLEWEGAASTLRLRDSRVEMQPSKAGWQFSGSGGTLQLPHVPEIQVGSFRGRLATGRMYLTEAGGNFTQGGSIRSSGTFAGESSLEVEWSGLPTEAILPDGWHQRVSGVLQGDAQFNWQQGVQPPSLKGRVRLTDGRLKEIALLDRIATFTSSPQFRRMPIQEASADVLKVSEDWQLTNVLIESKGLMRATGNLRIRSDRAMEGTFELGVAPQVLQWIPGSRERVFTRNESGYVWTTVQVGGSLDDPREDLSTRLALAAKNEVIETGAQILGTPVEVIREGADGVLDALAPLLR